MFAFFSHLYDHTCNHKIIWRNAKPRMNNAYLIVRTVVAINGSMRNVYHSNWCTVQYSIRKLTSWTHLLWESAPFTLVAIEWDQNGYSCRSNTMQRKPESWSWDQCPLNGWLCAAQVVTHQLRSVCSKIENIDTSARILDSWSLAKQKRWLYNRELDVVICLLVHCSKLAPVDEIAFVSY